MILALDTSTSAITVAVGDLSHDGEVTIRDRRAVVDPRAHTEHLAPLIQAALSAVEARPADLDQIVVGTGPGPFTGLRVGLVTAVTMGAALGIPVSGVCSLDALAQAALTLPTPPPELLVATDARRKEIYWARYALSASGRSAYEPLTGPAVDRPADVPAEVASLPVVGRGTTLYPALLPHPLDLPQDVDAEFLLTVAGPRIVAGENLPVSPLYLRRPDALTTAERAAR